MINNKKIIITGGTGYLGKHIIKKYHSNNEITVFSRDEAKQYYLKKEYPNVKFLLGDISDFQSLNKACYNNDIGIFAASMKQIEACDQNPIQAHKTILQGALNSKESAIRNNFESACFISTDKSRSATTIYGALKFAAGESFILNNENSSCNFSTVIYGNVLNSTGSIIPMIWNAVKTDTQLILFSEEMTRFVITIEEAIELIEKSLNIKNVNVLPNLKSMKIKDLFEIYSELFGLKYQIGSPRVGEKIHEIMASSEELPRMNFLAKENIYIMHPKKVFNQVRFNNNEFSSKDVVLEKDELKHLLSSYNFFKL